MNSGSSSSSSQLPRVCIITGGIVEGDAGKHLFMVDLNDAESKDYHLTPTAEVGDDSCAICVIESTIYMFESEHVDDFEVFRKSRKFVFSYALSTSDHVTLKLQNQTKVCSMNDTKFFPGAISTPDGSSIVVYSSAIRPSYINKTTRCDFELFDVAKGKCQRLPQLSLRPNRGSQKTVPIVSAVLKGGSVLLVLLETRIYSLNLNLSVKESCNWESFTDFDNCVPMGTPFDLIGNELCLTSFMSYDVHTGINSSSSFSYLSRSKIRGSLYSSFTYPDLSKSDRIRGSLHPLLLDGTNPQDARFCILHPGIQEEEDDHCWGTPHFIIDIYTCDVDKFAKSRNEKKNDQGATVDLPATTKINSLHFFLPKNDVVLLRNCRFTSIPKSN